MMKRTISVILTVILCMCILSCGFADENDYDSIKTFYELGISDEEKAFEYFGKLKRYYEDFCEEKDYKDSRLMYYYACGRIAIINGDYDAAKDYLGDCGEFGYNITEYYSFARGMSLAQSSDESGYPEAITLLKSVQVNPLFTSVCMDTIKDCETRYRETMLDKAKKACLAEKHEDAQNYYSQILDVLPDDSEVKQAYNECLTHNGKVEIESSIVFKNAYAGSEASVVLKWDGDADEYTVWYMADMKNGTDKQQLTVSGEKCTVEGLLPNTCYLFRVESDGAWAEEMVETEMGGDYSEVNSDFMWTGSSTVYCLTKQRDRMLDSGKTSFEYYSDAKVKPSADKVIPIYDPAISDSCVLFVFTTFGIPENMKGQPYKILLHVQERGTLVGEGMFGDEKVCDNNNRIYLLMYDLLDVANDSYPNLSGVAFSVDLLMDGKIVCSSEGVFE